MYILRNLSSFLQNIQISEELTAKFKSGEFRHMQSGVRSEIKI